MEAIYGSRTILHFQKLLSIPSRHDLTLPFHLVPLGNLALSFDEVREL